MGHLISLKALRDIVAADGLQNVRIVHETAHWCIELVMCGTRKTLATVAGDVRRFSSRDIAIKLLAKPGSHQGSFAMELAALVFDESFDNLVTPSSGNSASYEAYVEEEIRRSYATKGPVLPAGEVNGRMAVLKASFPTKKPG
ncbi:hypothetical protein [Pinirhizobacter sp.]|jgi:hypothetical protein|uniref:hypothetical protein n=1 Tax=Pinirhizobacter sp. TaxID=2950432 RepID=UPI002F40E2B4